MMTTPTTATLPLLLKSLALPTFVREYAVMAAQAAREGLSHAAYLQALTTQELSERAARRVERLLVESKLPREKSLATFDLTRLPAPVRTAVATLRDGAFLAQATNVIVFGHPGTGKTHLVCGLGLALVRQQRPVLFTPMFQLVQRLLAAKRDLRLAAELKRLDRFEALILDDLGYVQQSREEMEVLFTLLAERYERRSIVITSNLVFSQWDQIFKDPMTTAAAVDRVVHHAVILELPIPSFRAQAAQARSQAPPGKRTPEKKTSKEMLEEEENPDGARRAP
jgi:DNA replication protein DnaC